jgi:hypothetical protein
MRAFISPTPEVLDFYNALSNWFLHFSEPDSLDEAILPKKNRNLGNAKRKRGRRRQVSSLTRRVWYCRVVSLPSRVAFRVVSILVLRLRPNLISQRALYQLIAITPASQGGPLNLAVDLLVSSPMEMPAIPTLWSVR